MKNILTWQPSINILTANPPLVPVPIPSGRGGSMNHLALPDQFPLLDHKPPHKNPFAGPWTPWSNQTLDHLTKTQNRTTYMRKKNTSIPYGNLFSYLNRTAAKIKEKLLFNILVQMDLGYKQNQFHTTFIPRNWNLYFPWWYLIHSSNGIRWIRTCNLRFANPLKYFDLKLAHHLTFYTWMILIESIECGYKMILKVSKFQN